jgi:Tfp pilus assembly protein PilX
MHMTLTTFSRRLARSEHGFAMVFALMVLFISGLLAAAAFMATNEDVTLTRTYSNQQKAYFAALAGLDEYKYELSANPNYWNSSCKASAEATVPGTTDEKYTYKTLGATGRTCEEGKQLSIIESADSASGTFRVLATGKVEGSTCGVGKRECQRSLVGTFTHPGYLNYAYLSNFEEADPETVGKSAAECEFYHKEREEKGLSCVSFPWIPADKIEGPFHTNDAAGIAGSPVFGRSGHNDVIEMNGGYYGGAPKFEGKGYTEAGATLLPPEAPAAELLNEAGAKYTGRTVIVLKENTMEVTNKGVKKAAEPYPTNGVISVVNAAGGCPIKYTPFLTKYTGDAECGNVYVQGKYNQSLTIIAQNDVIITGNLTTEGGEAGGQPTGIAALGLIAIQHARLYHPVKETCTSGGKKVTCEATESTCNAENAAGGEKPTEEFGVPLKNPYIDAAILSTKHSWGVDSFSCGAELGTITVWGSIAENWRGRVTCCLSGGDYVKSYKWDERLATDQPPSFLAPSATNGWKLQRETAPPE